MQIITLQMYCRPPLVKSMSRSSMGGQSQAFTAVNDDDEERTQTTTSTGAIRRDSESM